MDQKELESVLPAHARSELYLHWAIHDALFYQNFTLSEDNQRTILKEIKPEPDASSADQLIRRLEGAISLYRARKSFVERQASKSDLRRKIAQLIRHIERLDALLRGLDWGTRRDLAPFLVGQKEASQPLHSAFKPPELEQLDEHLCGAWLHLMAVAAAGRAYLQTIVPTKGGRRPHSARIWFAVDIADALTEIVPEVVPIVATQGSTYEGIVGACLAAADGRSPEDLRVLIRGAVKAFRKPERPQGVSTWSLTEKLARLTHGTTTA